MTWLTHKCHKCVWALVKVWYLGWTSTKVSNRNLYLWTSDSWLYLSGTGTETGTFLVTLYLKLKLHPKQPDTTLPSLLSSTQSLIFIDGWSLDHMICKHKWGQVGYKTTLTSLVIFTIHCQSKAYPLCREHLLNNLCPCLPIFAWRPRPINVPHTPSTPDVAIGLVEHGLF